MHTQRIEEGSAETMAQKRCNMETRKQTYKDTTNKEAMKQRSKETATPINKGSKKLAPQPFSGTISEDVCPPPSNSISQSADTLF